MIQKLEIEIKKYNEFIFLIINLKDPSFKSRHWNVNIIL